ncbi:hypothetical protein KEM48_000052 [Puccinia striiformis f. sp. tritici PST-130]|nr:hypothetical protein KEM48_000052 [Puccinia striiformis f. sp. tritici PST-130]
MYLAKSTFTLLALVSSFATVFSCQQDIYPVRACVRPLKNLGPRLVKVDHGQCDGPVKCCPQSLFMNGSDVPTSSVDQCENES